MSTISGSTADTSLKYQRLSVEFVKLRNQVSTLKTALLDEQAKNDDQQQELNLRDQKIRKLSSENESLLFRNEQLVKRVEALQTTLDDTNATFFLAKNKKKHKEANLRLFGESSRQAFSTPDPAQILEQELERKIVENCELHSKIFDLEKQHESTIKGLTQRIEKLIAENARLKEIMDNRCLLPVHSFNGQPTVNEKKEEMNPITCSKSSQLNGKSVENGSTSSDSIKESKATIDCSEDGHYLDKIKHLASSLRHVTGRAEYYKIECESLLKRILIELSEKTTLQKRITELDEKSMQLNDALETTRRNYESQMRGLYEHMAEQDAKIVEQSERLLKGVTENIENSVPEKKENRSTLSQNLRKIVGK